MEIAKGGACELNIDTSNHADLLRWWHQYQARMLNQEADFIRNGLMQDIFAVRRQLELSCQARLEAEELGCQRHLAELKHIYTLLENLSNRLESPYLQNSLPLALQHAFQPWQEKIYLQANLPNTWEPEAVEHTRLLTLFTENLLQLLATTIPLPDRCEITLKRQDNVKELSFHPTYRKLPSPEVMTQISSSLQPFLTTFQLLTQGDYDETLPAHSLNWVLRWQTPTSTPV